MRWISIGKLSMIAYRGSSSCVWMIVLCFTLEVRSYDAFPLMRESICCRIEQAVAETTLKGEGSFWNCESFCVLRSMKQGEDDEGSSRERTKRTSFEKLL